MRLKSKDQHRSREAQSETLERKESKTTQLKKILGQTQGARSRKTQENLFRTGKKFVPPWENGLRKKGA